MRLTRRSNQERIIIDPARQIGKGGEATVYALAEHAELVVKVYHAPNPERARKLEAMVASRRPGSNAPQGHVSIAWPIDLAVNDRNEVVGPIMERLPDMRKLFDVYVPKSRIERCPLFNYQYLLRTARNLAAAVEAIHDAGVVIGDINESNILVSETALVALVDTDSFQVRNPVTGELFRCGVGRREYTPPELQSATLSGVDRTVEHDRFGLAVIIFQLLMEGRHPFGAPYRGIGDSPPVEQRIAAGDFPYGHKTTQYVPDSMPPTFESLDPKLRDLFLRCFEDGHRIPDRRPTATEWGDALEAAEARLVTCAANAQHRYFDVSDTCPWCARKEALAGRDPFPTEAEVRAGRHLSASPQLPKRSQVALAPPSVKAPVLAASPAFAPARAATASPASGIQLIGAAKKPTFIERVKALLDIGPPTLAPVNLPVILAVVLILVAGQVPTWGEELIAVIAAVFLAVRGVRRDDPTGRVWRWTGLAATVLGLWLSFAATGTVRAEALAYARAHYVFGWTNEPKPYAEEFESGNVISKNTRKAFAGNDWVENGKPGVVSYMRRVHHNWLGQVDQVQEIPGTRKIVRKPTDTIHWYGTRTAQSNEVPTESGDGGGGSSESHVQAERPGMKTCPTCLKQFPASYKNCPNDGTPL